MADRSIITPELCRQLLRYEPETGKLFWRKRTAAMLLRHGIRDSGFIRQWHGRFAGKEALASLHDGYRVGRIFNTMMRAHRVIWAIIHGEWPTDDIDHINGDRSDNRISNLRAVVRRTNCRNVSLRSNNTSGCVGVSWSKSKNRWAAQIGVEGRVIPLGRFKIYEDAVTARKAAERRFGFHPNHGRQAVLPRHSK